ncbi:ImmA/IrrE family metallo-endopeptidase [Siminovitchia sediminis]|uniref:ImmA/IrrE family metallo-endopeptidase n=1 Tax=Siminovitchia sediminis TaxID=1274353 RepID=A0ABW4KMY2_9BACI
MQTLTRIYPTTTLEDWVTDFYSRLSIYRPEQIDIQLIASRFRIYVHTKPMPSSHQIVGRYRGITLDSRESKEIQREMFFHELCHILRHYGVQTMMPDAFRELQEWDARNFIRYAAIPQHMLQYINFEDPYVIDQMSNLFKVTPELCEERLKQIKNRYICKAAERLAP